MSHRPGRVEPTIVENAVALLSFPGALGGPCGLLKTPFRPPKAKPERKKRFPETTPEAILNDVWGLHLSTLLAAPISGSRTLQNRAPTTVGARF